MDVVEEYLKNLKRLDEGERWILENGCDEKSKEFKAWLKILENCKRLYPIARQYGCSRVTYDGKDIY